MAGWPAANDPRDEFVVWKVEEHARAWILRFETRRWLDTRDFREQSIGAVRSSWTRRVARLPTD
jgi:hypothetical protein